MKDSLLRQKMKLNANFTKNTALNKTGLVLVLKRRHFLYALWKR